MKTIAFFNNKGGVGKTTLVYHLSWMYAELGFSVVAADLDPQANLSAVFLREDRLEQVWSDDDHHNSILGAVSPILRGLGDIREPHVEEICANLGLVVGDLGLSSFEARLSSAWPDCLGSDESAFRIESAFHRTILDAAEKQEADVVLIDVGPNLGAINRAAIIAANFVVFPLAPDLFSLQALRNIGPTLHDWRTDWRDRVDRRPEVGIWTCHRPRLFRRATSSCNMRFAQAAPCRHTRSGSSGFRRFTGRRCSAWHPPISPRPKAIPHASLRSSTIVV